MWRRFASLAITAIVTATLSSAALFSNTVGAHARQQEKLRTVKKPVRRYLLVEAAGAGNLPLVKSLLAQGADINVQYPGGQDTPLIEAVVKRRAQVANYLLSKGADVNVKNFHGATALWFAIYDRDHKTAVALIRKGAEVNIQNAFRETPLYRVAGWPDTELVKALLDRGADVNVMTKVGDTPLLQAVMRGMGENALLILRRGAKVNVRQPFSGMTPLMGATLNRLSGKLIKEMVARGADINAQDKDGWTALMHATVLVNLPAVQSLTALGANVHIHNKEGKTALQIAQQGEKKPAFGAKELRPTYRRIIKLLRFLE